MIDISFDSEGNSDESRDDDHVLSYARDVLTLGLLYMEFQDAIREGDGEHILRCWKYLLLIFKASHRTNYSVEAFTWLAQYNFIFSERMRQQLLWSRTINVRGQQGKNIPCYLHMEQLNCELKGSIGGLGANITENAIQHVGKSLRSSTAILEMFDQSGHHMTRASDCDISKLLKQVHTESNIFAAVQGRQHRNYPNFKSNIIKNLKKSDLLEWFQDRYHKLITYH